VDIHLRLLISDAWQFLPSGIGKKFLVRQKIPGNGTPVSFTAGPDLPARFSPFLVNARSRVEGTPIAYVLKSTTL
jgi:hypothetical protein